MHPPARQLSSSKQPLTHEVRFEALVLMARSNLGRSVLASKREAWSTIPLLPIIPLCAVGDHTMHTVSNGFISQVGELHWRVHGRSYYVQLCTMPDIRTATVSSQSIQEEIENDKMLAVQDRKQSDFGQP